MVDMLLELGAEPGTATQQGATPLQLALRAGHDELAEYLVGLLDSPAALNATDVLQWTALHCAAQRVSLPAVEMLLKVSSAAGASCMCQDLHLSRSTGVHASPTRRQQHPGAPSWIAAQRCLMSHCPTGWLARMHAPSSRAPL